MTPTPPRSPGPRLRRFRAVYLLLTANFFFPAVSYALFPDAAIAGFERIGLLLGAGPYPLAAVENGLVWRILAVGNVLTLAFMCGLLWWDLERFYPVRVPLVFMKGFSTAANLAAYLFLCRFPGFLAIFALDGVTAWAMWWFAGDAKAELDAR